jgi:uncharacterized membrane protein YfcA
MAVKVSKLLLKTYIGILVLIMGVLILLKTKFEFSWKRIFGIAIISAFNKGLSGGGFGPIITGGQIISGNKPSSSIGSTTLAEAPICIVGFLTYLLTRGLASYNLLVALSIGALIGGICGPIITKIVDSKKLKYILGILIITEGIAVLAQVITKKSFGG